jgi:hypothetical protein
MSYNELLTENVALKEKLWGICKWYSIFRPVLKFLRIFSFIKPGAKAAIDAGIIILDDVCEVK